MGVVTTDCASSQASAMSVDVLPSAFAICFKQKQDGATDRIVVQM